MPADDPDPGRAAGSPSAGLPVTAVTYLGILGDAIRAAPDDRRRADAVAAALIATAGYRADGVTWEQIARALGHPKDTVEGWVRRRGDTKPTTLPRPRHPPWGLIRPTSWQPVPPPGSWRVSLSTESISQSITATQSQSSASTSTAWAPAGCGSDLVPAGRTRRVMVASGDPRPGENVFALEAVAIRGSLRMAGIDVREMSCVGLAEIPLSLDDMCPTVLHLAAHSSFGGVVLLLAGDSLYVPVETLAKAVVRARIPPRLVVANFCDSACLAGYLAQAVEVVIAWPGVVDDEQSRLFAGLFYGLLASGRPVREAARDATEAVVARWPGLCGPELFGTPGERPIL
ncbi:MAG TPA: hypothetical protein VLJ59_11510 [Mycobacteriales bacterium]|nr:hypothetical protein [Mycobacteriales bacterium]